MKRIDTFIVSASAALAAFPFFAFAQTLITISPNIPGGTAVTTTTSPGSLLLGIYNFALLGAGVLALGVIVWGGFRYTISRGDPTSQHEGVLWIRAALWGILLLGSAYVILYTINPNLVNLSLPGIAGVGTLGAPPSGPPGGGGGGGGGTCTPPQGGPCTVAGLQGTCMGGNAIAASEICNAESGGNAILGGDISTNGQPVSVGLFQINLSANTINGLNCPSAFDHTWHAPGVCGKNNTGCGPSTITNPALYAQCVAAARDIAANIAKACQLSSNGTNWNQWSTHTKCGL